MVSMLELRHVEENNGDKLLYGWITNHGITRISSR